MPGPDGSWQVCLLDPGTLEPLTYLEPQNEERLGVVRVSVAGTGYRIKDARSQEFSLGRPVALVPEPRNKHDRRAIAVRSVTGTRTAGYVPAPKPGQRDVQDLVHRLLSTGPVQAVVLESEVREGSTGPWVAMRIAASQSPFLWVDRPWEGDDLKELKSKTLAVEGDRWPDERVRLRAQVERSSSIVDRHFALQELAQRAYRLREVHPEALEDAIAACREQIALAEAVGPALRQSLGAKPAHHGFKQLAIILEKQRRYEDAIGVVEEAAGQGWDGDWERRLARLRKRTP